MQARKITPEDFARRHPAGQLGRNLRLTVRQVMHCGDEVAWANPDDTVKSAIIAMNRHPLGAACVVGPEGRLSGIVTDGDLRRALEADHDIRQVRMSEVMTTAPVTIGPEATCAKRCGKWKTAPRRSPSSRSSRGRCRTPDAWGLCGCTIFIKRI